MAIDCELITNQTSREEKTNCCSYSDIPKPEGVESKFQNVYANEFIMQAK